MNKIPDREECLKLLSEYGTPYHVIKHCMAVCRVAVSIGERLNEKGYNIAKKGDEYTADTVLLTFDKELSYDKEYKQLGIKRPKDFYGFWTEATLQAEKKRQAQEEM